MISVLDDVKFQYKCVDDLGEHVPSVPKKYFVVFRDYGQMKDNSQMVSESLQITESICSSGNFKVGLCESASCKLSVLLYDNVKNDEITVFQVLGDFEPTITNPLINRDDNGNLILATDTEGVQLSGDGLQKLTTTYTSSNIIDGLSGNNFLKEENYLVLAKFRYIGNPIYLYVETPGGNRRMVYYLKSGLFNFSNLEAWDSTETYNESQIVLHNNFVWESRTQSNTIEPGSLVDGEPTNAWKNITRYVQVAIPIIGSEYYEYKMAVYAVSGVVQYNEYEQDYGTLLGTASIYKLDYPIMPLGLYTIKSCKRKDDANIRNIEAYDRMMDVGLDVDIYFGGATTTQIGSILDKAAEGTQIVIGSNLSKEPIYPVLTNGPDGTQVSFNQFPTGDIYKVTKEEEWAVQGTYTEELDTYTRVIQKTEVGNYKDVGSYSQTQMQVMDGNLDEGATSSNKEFSTTLYKTMQGKLIDEDDSKWGSSSGITRQVSGKRRQLLDPKSDSKIEKRSQTIVYTPASYTTVYDYHWEFAIWINLEAGGGYWDWISSGNVYDDEDEPPESYKSDTEWFIVSDVNKHSRMDYDESWEPSDWNTSWKNIPWSTTAQGCHDWTYNQNSKITYGGKEYVVLDLGTETSDPIENPDPPEIPRATVTWTQKRTTRRSTIFTHDTKVGYFYSGLDSTWEVDTTGHTGKTSGATEYYQGQTKSTWVDTSGNTPWFENSYLDLKKTLYWKYTWPSLISQGAGDGTWSYYDGPYQSLTYNSGPKYALTSARPANYYSSLNVVYSAANVYKIMSKRYTRTHTYDYTFPQQSGGWAPYSAIYVKDTSSTNRKYTGVTLADQKKASATVYSNVTVYNTVAKDYRNNISYGYKFIPPAGNGWTHPDPDYIDGDKLKYVNGRTEVVSGITITHIGDTYATMWRTYKRQVIYTWQETAVLREMIFNIPNFDSSAAYTVYTTYPTDSEIYINENRVLDLANAQVENYVSADGLHTSIGVLDINRQSEVRTAIEQQSTKNAEVDNNGVFHIFWVQSLTYTGYISYDNNVHKTQNYSASGTLTTANPFLSCVLRSQAEKFHDMFITWGREAIHGTRRSVIAGYMELHGLFINFDRWGVSTTRNVKSSTLYPAENLYPHDSTVPGLSQYGDIYPSLGSTEVTDISICKSIYIDDDLNNEFDGVVIVKSQVNSSEASYYPFYYNRQSKRYGALPSGMPEVSTTPWEGNNYYRIENNFFFDNFIFTAEQLKSICIQILNNIGDLQYFNLTAELRALPYMEVGDSINIMTPKNGYETAILRRVMKGNIAQMDSIETDFY